jgi:hypothetical protein
MKMTRSEDLEELEEMLQTISTQRSDIAEFKDLKIIVYCLLQLIHTALMILALSDCTFIRTILSPNDSLSIGIIF